MAYVLRQSLAVAGGGTRAVAVSGVRGGSWIFLFFLGVDAVDRERFLGVAVDAVERERFLGEAVDVVVWAVFEVLLDLLET